VRASDLVFDGGDRVVAMGLLVREEGEWWLNSRRISMLMYERPDSRSEQCSRLIDASGHIAAFQAQDPTAARRWLHVIGPWRENTISVEAIAAGPGRPDRLLGMPPDPPGPPPPGGWRPSRRDTRLDFDLGDLQERGIIVAARPIWYSDNRLVLVVAATDPAVAATHLTPQLPGQVAIVACPYTRADIAHVAATFGARARDWRFEMWGTEGTDESGQPYAFADLFRVPRDMADWADQQPAGLLHLDPSVRPEAALHH
jgi:hypothetical protein